MSPHEAYALACKLVETGQALELSQSELNALAMHGAALVSEYSPTPPVVAEVSFLVRGKEHVARARPAPASPVQYEHRGLDCLTHGLAAHRRARKASGPWECVKCAPLTLYLELEERLKSEGPDENEEVRAEMDEIWSYLLTAEEREQLNARGDVDGV